MRTEVTAEEIEHYRAHGFVVIEDLLDQDEVKQWRQRIDAAVAGRLRGSGHPTKWHEQQTARSDESPTKLREHLDYYERVFVQQVNLWTTDDSARELVIDERLGRIAAELAGVGGIRLYHDQALFKPPWGNPTAFHLDLPYWSFNSADALTIWIALDDTTTQNGCLHFVPGSHKAQSVDDVVVIGEELGALFEHRPEWNDIDPVPCPLRTGSASVHNGLTAHGAGANLTPRPRRAMTLQLMPDGATYNGRPNVLPPEVVAKLVVGDPLDNERINPTLWSTKAAQPAK